LGWPGLPSALVESENVGEHESLEPSLPQACPRLPSEGSVIAYYWSEFSIPQHLEEEAERAMAEERVTTLPPRARSLSSFVLTSVVAFRESGTG
jgi:suppressor of tumorigenicity protein 14